MNMNTRINASLQPKLTTSTTSFLQDKPEVNYSWMFSECIMFVNNHQLITKLHTWFSLWLKNQRFSEQNVDFASFGLNQSEYNFRHVVFYQSKRTGIATMHQ